MGASQRGRVAVGERIRRGVVAAAAVALVAGLSVGPAQAGGRGGGGVIKPVDQTGCTARLRGERSQAYWSTVAYRTGEFRMPAQSVRRAAGMGRVSSNAIEFDGRDGDGLWLTHATVGYDLDAGELLATKAAYPANMADGVDRPGFNGVEWSSRAIVGGVNQQGGYPYATDAAAYGAYGAEDAVALVRVGPYVVPVDPWTPVEQDGPRETREVRERLERGRQEWLRERGFVGQVRTFVNDTPAVSGRDAREDRPVAKFVGVSKPGDAEKRDESEGEGVASPDADAAAAKGEAGTSEAPGAKAVIHLNEKPISRMSLPHAAGLRNAGTRVVESRAKEPANDAGK